MTRIAAVPLLFLAGCLPGPVPEAPEPEPAVPPPPAVVAWTADRDVVLVGDSTTVTLPLPFTRLEVVGGDSLRLLVRCDLCPGAPYGSIAAADAVFEPVQPEAASHGSLAEFVLAVRSAAAERNLEALLPVMSAGFSYSFVGPQTPAAAFAVWRAEEYATLDRLPQLLDRGLTLVDGRIWAAPPEYAEETGYRGLRSGFRQRQDGRWEWIFLIRGVVE